MTSTLADICYICRKEMHRRTKLVWVFGIEYDTLGQAHSSCTLKERWYSRTGYGNKNQGEEYARFVCYILNQDYKYATPSLKRASNLALQPHDPFWLPGKQMNDDQVELLAYWQKPDGLNLDDSEVQATVKNYEMLIDRYLEATGREETQ